MNSARITMPRRSRPQIETLESRQLLSQVPGAIPARRPYPMQVMLAPRSAVGSPHDGVTDQDDYFVVGRTLPRMIVGMDMNGDGRLQRGDDVFTRSNREGWFTFRAEAKSWVDRMEFGLVTRRRLPMVPLTVANMAKGIDRPFDGNPTPGGEPFGRLVPDSQSYAPGLPPRPDAAELSESLEEDPANPAFESDVPLGLVFFGQFVDHDVTLMNVVGQGPTPDPVVPRNVRTPALDLDSVYGGGPQGSPRLYTDDGLFFRVGPGGQDLYRDDRGVAIIVDERNDENGQIAQIHLAFQRFHNAMVKRGLAGMDPASLNARQRDALFGMARRYVLGYYQGIVANQFAPILTGRPLPSNIPALDRMPVEFTAAIFRIGHTLVPNEVIVDTAGTRKSPVDHTLRGPGAGIPFPLLFGPNAQPAAAIDDQIAPVMRKLLIPVSPNNPHFGELIGGGAPNIGSGRIIGGILHLDLMETNFLRGREQQIPSGEEYLHRVLLNEPYDPTAHGNTDLFVYMLRETVEAGGHYGPVGRDIFERTIGGILAADPYRYDNPAVYSPQQIATFRNATFEGLLRLIGEPGF